jgi:hypothetical protein
MKNKRILMLLIWMLILAMAVPTVGFAADDTETETLTPGEVEMKEAAEYGSQLGTLDGQLYGYMDYRMGKTDDYTRHLPSDSEIKKLYSLNKDTYVYENNFIDAYKDAFQIAYRSAYRLENVLMRTVPLETAYDQGQQAGATVGDNLGLRDFYQGKDDSWLLALSRYVAGGTIESRFYLFRETDEYSTDFQNGFREGFRQGYTEAYQLMNLNTELNNLNYKTVSMYETTIYFDEDVVHYDNGVRETETLTPVELSFDAGTLYQPTPIYAYKQQSSFNLNNYKYVPVTSKYIVSIGNQSGSVQLNKSVTLRFQYYGTERAGIYKWENSKWNYLYSTFSDGYITTEIPAGFYDGGEYAVFIDNNYSNFADISFNWAKAEIFTLMRRGVVEDTVKYYPDQKITRGDFAKMIYGAMSPKSPLTTSSPAIANADALGTYLSAVKYVTGKGYMTLEADGTFDLSSELTYSELENTFSKMFVRTFNWQEVAVPMLYEAYTRSAGSTDKSAAVTRAEAAYAVYTMVK